MGPVRLYKLLSDLKIFAVEIAGTIVFVAFVAAETRRAVRHILNSGRGIRRRRKRMALTTAKGSRRSHLGDKT
jgi:hypothetical protein